MRRPSQLLRLRNCWNATNECWILMKNVLSMGICAFTKACRLPSQGNIWMTVVRLVFTNEGQGTKREAEWLKVVWSLGADKKFLFSWLRWPTWAASSGIWVSDPPACACLPEFAPSFLGWSQHHLAGAVDDLVFVPSRSGSLLCFLIVKESETHGKLSWMIVHCFTTSFAHYWQE